MSSPSLPLPMPRRIARGGALALALGLGACSTVPDDVVTYHRDEKAMELALVEALDKAELRYTVQESAQDINDVYITLEWGDDTVPTFRTVIDTLPSSGDGLQRAVLVYLYTDQRVAPAGRVPTLELLNAANQKYWVGELFLSDDGDIRGEWAVNTQEGGGLSAFSVVSMVRRYAALWFDVYPELKACEACRLRSVHDEGSDEDDKLEKLQRAAPFMGGAPPGAAPGGEDDEVDPGAPPAEGDAPSEDPGADPAPGGLRPSAGSPSR